MHVVVRFSLAVAMVVGLLAFAATTHAQPADVVRIVEVNTTRFPTVEATVAYTTGSGKAIASAPGFDITLGETKVDGAEVQTTRLPIAVSIVADLSARMSERGSAFQTRFATMQPLVDDLLDQLTVDLDPQGGDGQFSAGLVTFSQNVATPHSLTTDLGAVGNTVNNANEQLRFQADALDSAEPGSPYPLGEAIRAGLDQLASADPKQPRALVVFAAGDPAQQLDTAALRLAFENARTEKRPIQLLVFGFGSDQPNEFDRFPANPSALRQLALDLDGSFIEVGVQSPDEQARRLIDEQFAGLLKLTEHYLLRFVANNVPEGNAVLRVAVGAVADTRDLDIGKLPPRFNVVVDTRNFQDRVRLSIKTEFQQAPISQVEYLLNNRRIVPPVEQGPNFDLEINTYDPAFQQRFPPGEYVLTAAVRDAKGNESRSEQEITVQVFAPPEPVGPLAVLQRYWWAPLILVLGLLAVGGFWTINRRRTRQIAEPRTNRYAGASAPLSPDVATMHYRTEDEHTAHYSPDSNEKTERYNGATDEKTERYQADTAVLRGPRWYVEVLEGDDPLRIELLPSQRHYDIGRRDGDYLPPINLKNRLVTRGMHATLELSLSDLELHVRDSANGTFFGEDKQPLERDERRKLKSGDVFWLSPLVKLRVEKVTGKDE